MIIKKLMKFTRTKDSISSIIMNLTRVKWFGKESTMNVLVY